MNKLIHRIKFSLIRRFFKKSYAAAVEKQLLVEEKLKDAETLEKLKGIEKGFTIYDEPIINVINLNANDVCNSKCVMCGIWQQKKTHEITPDELYTILTDPLYKNIEHIGVTGGEPTLREDLPQLYEAIFKALPNIKGVSSITNCIRHEDVITRIEQVIDVCNTYGKPFSMMVSLDGVGIVHERVRRIKGNFDSALKVLNHFNDKGVKIATGTTISKINVWDVDEMLDFLIENKFYGRFRIAEFIKRLYNDGSKGIIRSFDEDETYHLILFFYKLIQKFEKDEKYIRTYKSIINMLSGGQRLIHCPYKTNGLVLNSRGEIAYCAPKSKIIGNSLENSSLEIYKKNLSEKERILKEDCNNCIHDYHASITYKEELSNQERKKWEQILSLKNSMNPCDFSDIEPLKKASKQAFITGWYGTETVGDKAILGQIIQELREQEGDDLHIIISGIYPIIVERTVKELKLNNISVVDAFSSDFVAAAKGSDVTIMGGGPLMDLEVLSLPLLSFKVAKENKKKTIVYGCGLGPLTKPDCITATKMILELADVVKLRDNKSVALAKEWSIDGGKISMSGDPAKKYLQQFKEIDLTKTEKKIIRCFLRDWTYEYSKDKYSYDEFLVQKLEFEKGIAKFIKDKVKELDADRVVFEHMHNFVIGQDDRDFSRYFIKKYFNEETFEVTYNKKLSTIESIVNAMKDSSLNICMRFHSVLFAHTLETDFYAIDYTLGGKILNYLTDNNSKERLVTKDDLTRGL